MAADVSWRGPAKRYAALYRDLVETRTATLESVPLTAGQTAGPPGSLE
jgi:hypothetical protein